MDYLQQMESLLGESKLDLTLEERDILIHFTDELVEFKKDSVIGYYSNNEYLKNALKKLIDSELYIRYFIIVKNWKDYNMKDFYKKMDDKE